MQRPGMPSTVVALLLVVAVAATVGSVLVFGAQDRISSDLVDVREPELRVDGSAKERQMLWALDVLNGRELTEAEVNARLTPDMLAEISATRFIEDTSRIAAFGPFELRGVSYDGPFRAEGLAIDQNRDSYELRVAIDPVLDDRIQGFAAIRTDLQRGPFTSAELVLHLAAAWLLFGTGLGLGLRSRSNRPANLLLLAGALWFAQLLELSDRAGLYTVGLVAGPIAVGVVGVVLLTYPTGRVWPSPIDRLVVVLVVAAAVAAIAHLVAVDTSVANLPRQMLTFTHDRSLATVFVVSGRVLTILAAIGVVAAGWLRRRNERRQVAPAHSTVLLAATVACGLVATIATAGLAVDHLDLSMSPLVSVAASLVPVGVAVSAMQDRQALEVATMIADIGDAPPRAGLQQSLARALSDPTVELVFWSPEQDDYVGSDGQPVDIGHCNDRAVTRLTSRGKPIGAVVHSPALLAEPERVRLACAAARLALDNERLQAIVRAQLADVRASRARLVSSAEQAQRRVERNLHDGAQQRLLALLLSIQIERQRTDAAGEHAVSVFLQAMSDELSGAIDELRELGRGLHPSALDHGLAAAVDSLAERSPLPVVASVAKVRCPPHIEAAAYFVIREAVTNATRHANADHVHVEIAHEGTAGAGTNLRVTVTDHGAGGADRSAGSGLQSLEDRVVALDGRWSLISELGVGTTVTAVFPFNPATRAITDGER